MNRTLKKLLSTLLAAAMVLSLAACGQDTGRSPSPAPSDTNTGDSAPAAGDTVKLILYTSITGSGSTTGTMQSQAAQAAVDYVNANGGIKSMDGAQVELVIVDSGSDTSAAALPLQRASLRLRTVISRQRVTPCLSVPMMVWFVVINGASSPRCAA